MNASGCTRGASPMRSVNGAGQVHLVGSVPVGDGDAESVFRLAANLLGHTLRRIPDGQTGLRTDTLAWQAAVFQRSRYFRQNRTRTRRAPFGHYALRPGSVAAEIDLGRLGNVEIAWSSYQVFARLKASGIIAPNTRFQVSLPTPMSVVSSLVTEADRTGVELIYYDAMATELANLQARVPPGEVAVQWDVSGELAMLERVEDIGRRGEDLDVIAGRLSDLGNLVEPGVELGYHLCHGHGSSVRVTRPSDLGLLVSLANAVRSRMRRSVDVLHLPVPRHRIEPEYFAPLRVLVLPRDTDLFLVLIHVADGVDGAALRIASARTAVANFGVATECGFDGGSPDMVKRLLLLHRKLIAPWDHPGFVGGRESVKDDRCGSSKQIPG